MSYIGIVGNQTYTFDTEEDYLLAIEIMNDLRESFEERMNYCDNMFNSSYKLDINHELKVEK